MKSYLSLVVKEAKVHQKQNYFTLFCISLAVFLVAGVLSMADMAVRMENQRLTQKNGDWLASAKNSSYFIGLYGAAAFLILLVLLAGVLMIAGSLNSNIAKRTQFFGMLRCIGASKKQIMRIVRCEALYWCLIAVPIGLLCAVWGTWGICGFLRFYIGGEFLDIPTGQISLPGILSGAFIGVITVLIAAHAPAKRASKVEPVVAVKGNVDVEKTLKKSAKTKLFKIEEALGIRYATISKKNLLLMTGSFALSIILFLSFTTMIDWVSHALTTLKPYTADVVATDAAYENTITKESVEQIKKISEVKHAFGRMYKHLPVETVYAVNWIDFISYEDLQFSWAEDELLCGDINLVKEKSKYCMTVFEKSSPFQLGDKIVINDRELEVGAILSDSPFSSDDTPIVICSEETFYQITGEQSYAIVDMQLTKNANDDTIDAVLDIVGENCNISDRRKDIKEANSTYFAFSFLVYSFLCFIALISIFNIMNSISMSVSAKMTQYGIMRAIGMDYAQLVRMILCEALTYAGCGCLAGCIIGLPVNRFFYQRFITNYWGTTWTIPYRAIIIIVILTLLSAILAVYYPARSIRKMEITDTIHNL